jgi:hypothetical protein
MDKKEMLGFCSNAIIIILEIWGLITMFSGGEFGYFIYYTILSNTFALITSIVYVIGYCCSSQKAKKSKENVNLDDEVNLKKSQFQIPHCVRTLRFMSSVCLTVTFVVVMTILLPYYLPLGNAYQLLFGGNQLVFHVIGPLLSLLSFCVFEKGFLSLTDVCLATLPTVIYGIVFIILNIARVVEGPYPFLMVYNQPVYATILYFFGILGCTFAFSKLVQWITNKFTKE